MKITTLMTKQAIIQLVLSAFLLLLNSCDACMQKPLGRETESSNVTLETYSVNKLGTINNDQLVIEIEGKIQENYINDTSTLCVIIIPEDKLALDAAKEFRKSSKTISKDNPYIRLPENGGAIYYASDLSANKKGPESAKLFLQDELQSGKYKVYLTVHSVTYGTYPSLKGRDVEKPDIRSIPVPTIQMDSVKLEVKLDAATKSRLIQIDADATAKNHDGRQGGFLFIEQENLKAEPIKMLAQLIKNRESIPTVTTDFQQLGDMAGIIMHSFKDTAGSAEAKDINHLSIIDKSKIFKKGVAYQVYAYLIEELSNGERHVIISKEDNIILKIPKPDVSLSMKGAKIVEMITYLGGAHEPEYACNHAQFELKGEIIKNEDTDDPKMGFFIAKGSSLTKDESVSKITSLIARPAIKNIYIEDINDLKYMLCMVGSAKPGDIGEKVYQPNMDQLSLELDQDYYIYFCLLDKGGDIFVSDNYQTISTPTMELSITKFAASRAGDKLSVSCEGRVSVSKFPGAEYGYIFIDKNVTLNDKAFLSQIIANLKSKKPQDILGTAQVAFLKSSILHLGTGIIDKTIDVDNMIQDVFKTVQSQTSYAIYTCCFNKESLYFQKASADVEFMWSEKPKKESKYTLRKIPIGTDKKDYLVYFEQDSQGGYTNAHIEEKDSSGFSTREVKFEKSKAIESRNLVKTILTTDTSADGGTPAMFSGEHVEQEIDKFINAMPKMP